MTRRGGVRPLRLSLADDDPDATQEQQEWEPRQQRGDAAQQHPEGGKEAGRVPRQGAAAQRGGREDGGVDLEKLRKVVRASLDKNLHDNAAFFANKLVTLSGAQPHDVLLLAQAYFMGSQYRRAVHLIQQHGFLDEGRSEPAQEQRRRGGKTPLSSRGGLARFSLEGGGQPELRGSTFDTNIEFVLLAVQCLTASGQHEEAQTVLEGVLGEPNLDVLRARAQAVAKECGGESVDGASAAVNPIAALCLLRGRVYETLDNRPRATVWFKAALFCDVFCYEAFDALVDNQLRPSEERQLMNELEQRGAFADGADWLRVVYASRLSKHDFSQDVAKRFSALDSIVAAPVSPRPEGAARSRGFARPSQQSLGQDLDCAADKAACLYQQHDPQGAYQVTRKIRQRDPYHLRCITVHLASLVELKRKSELFHTAHHLVDAYPSKAVAWFAVGCYYFCISKFDAARRFFHKATSMDPSMAEAWLGFGHAFAAQDESDQAMAAYRTASRLFTGCHLPVLCTAIEYLRTNNVTLAEQFCRQAKSMCASDPLVFNELGVVHFRQKRFQIAVDCFLEALKLCRNQPERLRHAWEPAMFNLAHAYRKIGRYEEAIRFYENALSYSPKEASTHAALGLTYHLQGRIEEAIQCYHNALGLKPEDTFSSEMLDKALAESFATTGLLGDTEPGSRAAMELQ